MPAQLQVPYLVYQAERRGLQGMVPHKHSNSASEASAFLTFIAEYYDCLPEVGIQPLSPGPCSHIAFSIVLFAVIGLDSGMGNTLCKEGSGKRRKLWKASEGKA